jgi:hypothetical protein
MFTNPNADWQMLAEHYREMGDGELLELAADIHDLTDVAQGVLRDEMRARGLGTPEAVTEGPVRAEDLLAEVPDGPAEVHWETHDRWLGPDDAAAMPGDGPPVEYSWKVPLAEFETGVEALQLAKALSRAGVESWLDRHAPRVLVAADQLEQAQTVAAMPIPQEIIEESAAQVPEFEIPACPSCGAPDPTLESADPVNCWHCDSCGNEWSESADLDQ